MGLFKFDFIGKSPATNRIPWINAVKSVFDGWVSKGKKIANMMCMDQENPEGQSYKNDYRFLDKKMLKQNFRFNRLFQFSVKY